jgi:hypothetical protein
MSLQDTIEATEKIYLIRKESQLVSSYRHGCRYPVPGMVTFRALRQYLGAVPEIASHPCDWRICVRVRELTDLVQAAYSPSLY